MSVLCPHCGRAMNVKGVRAGTFQPKCSRCGAVFQLVVGAGPDAPMVASPLPGEVKRASVNAEPTAAPGDGVPHDPAFSVDATEVGAAEPALATKGTLPRQLGGYRIERELGRGGMGTVYLARQVSLDRLVALKVMNARWASNPAFVVRFTREAYAAAQLVHHNIVQVYDVGSEAGVSYFSMEYVEGQSLGDLLRKEGRLSPEAAAGYVLQAARGLRFAHDRGMIHRDVKPANLLLNAHGVVKVADLGLVRTPGMEETPGADASGLSGLSGVTLAGQAMGTASYMAPEQARDATAVDARADVYSLGCTLYVLLTGRPVFPGKTALEVITRHAAEPAVRPEDVSRDVPRALGDIVLKMIAKKPEDRYQGMADVVKALEDFLGIHGGQAAATQEHLRELEAGVKAFNASPLAGVRSLALAGFFTACGVLFVLLLFTSWWRAGTFFLALGGSAALAYLVARGSAEQGYLFRKGRDALLTTAWSEWLKLGGVALIALLVLFFLNLLWVWLLAAALGVGLAFGLHFGLDRPIAAERAAALEGVERMLKTLRLRGLSEEAVQEFVAAYAGYRWEEFFEALFGYEAKIAARARHADRARPTHAAWREPVLRWIEAVQKRRQEAKEKAHLSTVERKSLEAQGVNAAEARARAEQVADAMVAKAAEMKQPPAEAAPAQAMPRWMTVQDLIEVPAAPKPTPRRSGLRLGKLLAAPFSGGPRLLLGVLLLVAGACWAWSNGLVPESKDADDAQQWVGKYAEAKAKAGEVNVPGVPGEVRRAVFSVGGLLAGVLLILSAAWLSWKIGVTQYAAAAVLLAGPASGAVPGVGPLDAVDVCLIVGLAVSVVGFLFGRDT